MKYRLVCENSSYTAGTFQRKRNSLQSQIEQSHKFYAYGFRYFPQQATIEWQRVSQTVGDLPTDPTTKEPQLGMIGRVWESVRDLWRLRMMSSAW